MNTAQEFLTQRRVTTYTSRPSINVALTILICMHDFLISIPIQSSRIRYFSIDTSSLSQKLDSNTPETFTELLGVTAQLSHWISNFQVSDIPHPVRERAKYQILDGIGCALVGAHIPWSEKYVETTAEYEPPDEYSVIGWDKVREKWNSLL